MLTRDKNHPIFMKLLYTAADFELDERHVIKNEKKVAYLHWTDSAFDRTYFLFLLSRHRLSFSHLCYCRTCCSRCTSMSVSARVRPTTFSIEVADQNARTNVSYGVIFTL